MLRRYPVEIQIDRIALTWIEIVIDVKTQAIELSHCRHCEDRAGVQPRPALLSQSEADLFQRKEGIDLEGIQVGSNQAHHNWIGNQRQIDQPTSGAEEIQASARPDAPRRAAPGRPTVA